MTYIFTWTPFARATELISGRLTYTVTQAVSISQERRVAAERRVVYRLRANRPGLLVYLTLTCETGQLLGGGR